MLNRLSHPHASGIVFLIGLPTPLLKTEQLLCGFLTILFTYLIEISSCLVKHNEVTQKYISELKKSKDYMEPDKTYFCISFFSLKLLCLPACH
uniref:Uncharacterized protein n=1 Tax=Suricata suricatta TaxID=37032 RepID=A0A673T154_SURSU